jgi:DNA-binding response OmpR family regulator
MTVAVTPAGVPRKILIVDDDQPTRSGLKALLEQAGYSVLTASTFAEARFALNELSPDLLISDVRLGEYNGLQLVATSHRAIPAIVVTGYPDPVLQAEARRLGAEFLVKPVAPSSLMALIKQKLDPATEQPVFSPARRWPRKRVTDLPARVNDRPARILDISYGGLRFELEREAERALGPTFLVNLPTSGVSVPVDLVWTTRSDDHWVCGAMVTQDNQDAAAAWHGLVDAMA